MRLETGARLGPYEIEAPLGAGGMGEVYRARDTRLDRRVAIKVLPAEFSTNETIRARFEREAKTISSLTHPNICTLHDVGREGDAEYLVMELLEGESLADRLARGPLPLDEALRAGIQIADALDRAHRSGVVHRDLKPGNVMLTPSGAKLLDFGLAKSSAIGKAPANALSNVPTEQKNLTEEGTILGTFQYMAPEQLEGQEADARTDIFAFGALFYEMITGHRAFVGKSRVSLIASILEHEPQPITAHQPLSPPALERLIRQCLKKSRDDRWQTAHDLSLQLRWIEEGGSQAGVPAPVVARRKLRERASWIIAASSGIVAALFAVLWYQAVNAPLPAIRTSVVPASLTGYAPDLGIVLSPDGSRVVYVGGGDGPQELWIRDLTREESQPIRGTGGGYYPFWSPDSNEIGFFAEGKLKRILVSGGGARTLADAPGGRGGSWSEDGTIVYAAAPSSPLTSIQATGGQPSAITTLEGDGLVSSHRWPWFLPGGRRLLFLAQTSEGGTANDASVIRVLDLDTGEQTPVVDANSSVQYAPSGHILYWSQGDVLAQRFDVRSLAVKGPGTVVAEKVIYTANEYAGVSVSSNGLLLFQSGTAMGGLSELAWIEKDGSRGALIRGADQYYEPALSPDGRRLVLEQGNQDLWVIDLARGSSSRFTFDGTSEHNPVWSTDGEWIYFGSIERNQPSIRRKRSSGVGADELVVERPVLSGPQSISHDGGRLLLAEQSAQTNWDVVLMDLESREVTPLVASPFIETAPSFGPTSDWVAYQSDETGRFEIYVQKITGDGGRWQISTNGGVRPLWSPDGRKLFFLRPGELHEVDIEAGEAFSAGIPRKRFDVAFREGPQVPYAIAADGERFIFVIAEQVDEKTPMTLVQNWTSLLGR
jgi:eukaryotic-like serine/threonine-protein kinase